MSDPQITNYIAMDDVDRIWHAAASAAPDVHQRDTIAIVTAAMLELDALITEDRDNDGDWPDAGDLTTLFGEG